MKKLLSLLLLPFLLLLVSAGAASAGQIPATDKCADLYESLSRAGVAGDTSVGDPMQVLLDADCIKSIDLAQGVGSPTPNSAECVASVAKADKYYSSLSLYLLTWESKRTQYSKQVKKLNKQVKKAKKAAKKKKTRAARAKLRKTKAALKKARRQLKQYSQEPADYIAERSWRVLMTYFDLLSRGCGSDTYEGDTPLEKMLVKNAKVIQDSAYYIQSELGIDQSPE